MTVPTTARILAAACTLALLGGCASPEPVLYPNERLRAVGEARAERDLLECRELAEAAGARGELDEAGRAAANVGVGGAAGAATGAVGGAVTGAPGTGAAVGAATGATAGLLRSIFSRSEPSPAYRGFVERCLRERGYDPVGWD